MANGTGEEAEEKNKDKPLDKPPNLHSLSFSVSLLVHWYSPPNCQSECYLSLMGSAALSTCFVGQKATDKGRLAPAVQDTPQVGPQMFTNSPDIVTYLLKVCSLGYPE